MTKTVKYLSGLVAALCMAAAVPVIAQDRLVQEAKDPVTGAAIRVYKTARGSRIEVIGKEVQLRKELVGETVVTTVKSPGDWLTISSATDKLTVTGAQGSAFVSRTDQRGAQSVKLTVARSTAASRAAALIGRLGLSEQSPLRPVLMTTRAMLLSARGDDAGTRELVSWVRSPAVKTVRVGMQSRTPTECWEAYKKEAIVAFEDMGDCLENVSWWNPFGDMGCAFIYDLRLVGAFTWYLDCVKLLGFIIG